MRWYTFSFQKSHPWWSPYNHKMCRVCHLYKLCLRKVQLFSVLFSVSLSNIGQNLSTPFFFFPGTLNFLTFSLKCWLLLWFNSNRMVFLGLLSLLYSLLLDSLDLQLSCPRVFFKMLIKLSSIFHLSSFLNSFVNKTKSPRRDFSCISRIVTLE